MINPRDLGRLADSSATAYPILFVFLALLLFSAIAFGCDVLAAGWLRVLIAIVATLSFAAAVMLVTFSAVFRPGLLRSAEHELQSKVLGSLMLDDSLGADEHVTLMVQYRAGSGETDKAKKRSPRIRRPPSATSIGSDENGDNDA